MGRFRAIVIDKGESGSTARLTDFDEADLMDGDVTVRVTHSTINYKDGLAISGKSPVVRRFPMIPGIDFAGIVASTRHARFKEGDRVILTGWGVGESHLGGLAEIARVPGDWLTLLPAGLSPEEAMGVGTAGFTSMLSLMAIERHGLKPDDGPAVVTGASGGVGSIAVALFDKAGWHVIAATGRPAEEPFLKHLGADEIIARDTLASPGKPLGKERWATGVDSVGSHTLANLLSQTKAGGAIAACGLVQGMDLPTSVAPFILRGVALLGINSVYCAHERRAEAWSRLAAGLDKTKLASLTRVVPFEDALLAAEDILQGKVRGRTVVKIR